jgi:hypothetical protein
MKQLKTELEKQLKEQIGFLITSCKLYDDGQHAEAKRLANTLRILLHEKGRTRSLLGQLSLRDIPWVDTADLSDPENLVSHFGLFSIQFNGPSGCTPWLSPKGTPTEKLKKSKFNEWWLNHVVTAVNSVEKRYFSRKKLILNVTETDGGAHVDSELDKEYAELSKKNILGFTAIKGGKRYPMLNPELPCLRQIAHEVLLTLQEKLPNFFCEPYDSEIKKLPYGERIEEGSQTEPFSVEMYIRPANT